MDNRSENRQNEIEAPRNNRRNSPVLPILIGSVLGIGTVILVTKYFLAGNELVDVTQPMLDEGLTKWAENKPANYRIQIEVKGNLNGIYDIQVVNHKVAKAAFGDQELTAQRTRQTWTVPGMIRMLELDLANQSRSAERGGKLMVRAEFDPLYGYPTRYQRLDYTSRQEASWKVVRFEIDQP